MFSQIKERLPEELKMFIPVGFECCNNVDDTDYIPSIPPHSSISSKNRSGEGIKAIPGNIVLAATFLTELYILHVSLSPKMFFSSKRNSFSAHPFQACSVATPIFYDF